MHRVRISFRDSIVQKRQHGMNIPARVTLHWCDNERDGVLNQRCLDCLLSHLFKRSSKKTSKLRFTGLCEGWPVTGEFPAQRADNVENASIWWRHHVIRIAANTWRRLNLHYFWCVFLNERKKPWAVISNGCLLYSQFRLFIETFYKNSLEPHYLRIIIVWRFHAPVSLSEIHVQLYLS